MLLIPQGNPGKCCRALLRCEGSGYLGTWVGWEGKDQEGKGWRENLAGEWEVVIHGHILPSWPLGRAAIQCSRKNRERDLSLQRELAEVGSEGQGQGIYFISYRPTGVCSMCVCIRSAPLGNDREPKSWKHQSGSYSQTLEKLEPRIQLFYGRQQNQITPHVHQR